MNTQSEALRCAKHLDGVAADLASGKQVWLPVVLVESSSAELRRLQAENDKLAEHVRVLQEARNAMETYFQHYMQDEADDDTYCVCGHEQHVRAKAVKAALELTKEQP